MEHFMNIYALMTVVLACIACAFGVAWLLSHQELRRQRQRADTLSDQLISGHEELIRLKERAYLLEDSKAALSAQFQILSQQTLEASTEALLKRAEDSFGARERLTLERMDNSLKPVAETLGRFEAQVKALEEARLKDTGGLKQEIKHLFDASIATRETTQKLAQALRRGAGVQGRWGEETLKNVLEMAGLTRFDFVEQASHDTESGRLRPDVEVKLPGGVFVIDAKANLSAFLESMEAPDEATREAHMIRHAQALRNHVRDLAAKSYWEQFKGKSPDFVAMFVPGDGFLAAALDRLPDLMREAMDKRVIIVTPTTVFALCKAVALGWRMESQIEHADAIASMGRELYARLSIMGGHVAGMGKHLGQAVDKYNEFVGSLETKVLTQARRLEDYAANHEGRVIEELVTLDKHPRPLTKAELTREAKIPDSLTLPS